MIYINPFQRVTFREMSNPKIRLFMKRIVSFVYVLSFLLTSAVCLQAQPSQKLVSVIVSPDHTDWRYTVNEEVTFTVQVYRNENLLKNVMVDYEFGPEFFPTTKKQDVILKEGKTTFKASMKTPGFLRCKVIAKVDGKNYEGLATPTDEQITAGINRINNTHHRAVLWLIYPTGISLTKLTNPALPFEEKYNTPVLSIVGNISLPVVLIMGPALIGALHSPFSKTE